MEVDALEKLTNVQFGNVDKTFEQLEKRLETIDRLNQIAIDKAVVVINERLTTMNEFRAQMKDQTATFLTKTEFKLFGEKIDIQIRALEDTKNLLADRASQQDVNWAKNTGYIALVIAVVSFIMKFV